MKKIIIMVTLMFCFVNVNVAGLDIKKYGICDRNISGAYAGSTYWDDYYKDMVTRYDKRLQQKVEKVIQNIYLKFDKKNLSLKKQMTITKNIISKLYKIGSKYGVFIRGDLKETDKRYKIYLIINYIYELLDTNLERLNATYCLNNLLKEDFLIIPKQNSVYDRFISRYGYSFLVKQGTKIEVNGPITTLIGNNKVNGILKSKLITIKNGDIDFSKKNIENYKNILRTNYDKGIKTIFTQKLSSKSDLDKFLQYYFENKEACSLEVTTDLLTKIHVRPCSVSYVNYAGGNEIITYGNYDIFYDEKTKIIVVTKSLGFDVKNIEISDFKFFYINK